MSSPENYSLTTTSEVTKIVHRWEIPKFADKVREGWTEIECPNLITVRGTLQLKLRLMPNSDGCLCFGIECVSSYRKIDSTLQASVGICITDANNTKIIHDQGFSKVPSYFMTIGNGISAKVIKRDVVLGNPRRYLPDEKLVMLCAIHYLEPGTRTSAADQVKEPSPVVPPPGIVQCMQSLLTEGRFSDFVVVAEGREFHVHRAVLAERSEVFRAMFLANMTERRNKHVKIDDLSADAVSDLLTFMYTDSTPNINKVAEELLAASEKYEIPRLKAVCEAELVKCFDIDNILDRLAISHMYRASQLKQAALCWIAKNAEKVIGTESWTSFCAEHPELINAVCSQLASYLGELKKAK